MIRQIKSRQTLMLVHTVKKVSDKETIENNNFVDIAGQPKYKYRCTTNSNCQYFNKQYDAPISNAPISDAPISDAPISDAPISDVQMFVYFNKNYH